MKAFQKIKQFLSVLAIRLKTESPRFFRNLFRFFTTLAIMATVAYPSVVEFINELTIYQVVVPVWVNKAVNLLGAMAAGAALVSKLAVKWDALSEREKEVLDRPKV